MKKKWGVPLLLVSIVITTLGSVLRIMGSGSVSEMLLWIGVIACLIAIIKIIAGIFGPTNK